MKGFACFIACLMMVGCTSLKIDLSQEGATIKYTMAYSDFHPSDALMVKLGEALNAAVAAMSAQKLPTVKPPVTHPVVPPVIEDPDPITDPVPPVNPPYKVGKIESLHGTGFVWKPVGENPPKGLVVLTPASWPVAECKIFQPDGVTLVEVASYSGLTNPNKPTYRFSRPGSAFPANCILSVGVRKYLVPDPSKRYD